MSMKVSELLNDICFDLDELWKKVDCIYCISEDMILVLKRKYFRIREGLMEEDHDE